MITTLKELFDFPSAYGIETLIIFFMFYSFCGWCIEVFCGLVADKKFVNRGFLMGPYCPIHGCGALLMTLILNKYSADKISVFFLSIFICGVLEYITSYIMEKVFKERWWDYSNKRFNVNGRVCLEMLSVFGITGVIVICFLNKFVISVIKKMPPTLRHILAISLAIIFIIDLTLSCSIVSRLNLDLGEHGNDNTELIRWKINQFLESMKSGLIMENIPKLINEN